ncbi:uncharacterized protein C1orf87 homolog [Trichechus manatus latirostris]|uniref:Uncharacterized protein C1orf87 homolog n=1 Tax=Trichechus manatus latirostris TaxID=127582 RepID=A0A2Y9D789_TRIMA|nr:uncharacterized protein C1orf87 homolog [Trichechus manatus latirostris]
MSSVCKTPHGSDAMPEIVVKIIGSKHFRYLVEIPKIKENENFSETQTALQKSVTGNARQMSREPPAPIKPRAQRVNCNPDDVEDRKDPENNQKPIITRACNSRFLDGKVSNQANVYCSSVPTGDQSLSYIHGLPRRRLRVWSLEQMARGGSDQPEVNYEKLLCFLKAAASKDPQPSRIVEDSDLRKIQSPTSRNESTSPQDPDSQSEVNKSLTEILKMALRAANGKLNTDHLNLSFRKEDHSFSGCLPPPKVRAICGKHGLYLTLSLLETLLNHQDLGYQNEIKWQNFVELLSRASSDMLSDLPTGKNEKDVAATPVEPEVPEMSQSKNEHMKTPEEELQPESPPADTLAPKDPLSSLKIRPVSQPFVDRIMKNESEECETWVDRFRKLENVLYLCDLSNTGVLEKERARRLIHNYNLIYNLSLSPRKIDQALRRFCSGENMLLEPALRYLKEL